MANRVLGIEFSPESIKLVEVGFGRRLKVFNFAVVDNRSIDPERRIDQLNHTLQVRGFEAKEGVVAVSGVQVEHRLLTLPPLSGRELKFVMQREAKKSAPAGVTDTYWDFEILQTKEELGIKKRQILLVTSGANVVADARNFFDRTRIELERVTTIGEALLNLTQNVGYWKKEVVKNIVHFAHGSVHVLFVQHGALLLCRDIPIRYGDVDESQRADRLLTEIKRSTLYFRQNFPQSEIDEILFTGEGDLIGAVISRAKEDLGVDTNVLRFDDNLDSSSFRGDWDEFRFHIPSLAAAMGAAWHKVPNEGLNLIPGKAADKEGAPAYKKLIKIAALVAVAIALLSGGRYYLGSRQARAELAQIEAESTALDPQLQQGAQAAAEQALADARLAFTERLASAVEWQETFRSLSLIVPDSAVFESLRIEGGERAVLIINGYLRGPQGQPDADFARFFESLRGLRHFASVEMPTQPSVSFEDAQDSAGTGFADITSRVDFEVRCVLNSSL